MAAPLSPQEAGKPGHVYELPPALTRQFLGPGRFARMGVIGDGSCFYHSVCSMLDIDGYRAASDKEQRDIAARFRCKFQDSLSKPEFSRLAAGTATGKTFEETRRGLCRAEVWADEVMIKLASRVLNMNLVFLDLGAGTLYCGVHGDETLDAVRRPEEGKHASTKKKAWPEQPTAVVVWVGREHFEPLVRVDAVDDKTGSATLTRVFEPRSKVRDQDVVKALMTSYLRTCPAV